MQVPRALKTLTNNPLLRTRIHLNPALNHHTNPARSPGAYLKSHARKVTRELSDCRVLVCVTGKGSRRPTDGRASTVIKLQEIVCQA